jgi:hypothetical protein
MDAQLATVVVNTASVAVRDLMVRTSVDGLSKYEYGSDFAMFPALAIFLPCTLWKLKSD